MKTILKPLGIALATLLSGCLMQGCVCSSVNLAWRGTVDNYDQKATTEGRIDNRPRKNDTSVNAEKQTDVDANVPVNTAKDAAASAASAAARVLPGKSDSRTERVPEGLDMTLEQWQALKQAYIECPECLGGLTDAERVALKAATGK